MEQNEEEMHDDTLGAEHSGSEGPAVEENEENEENNKSISDDDDEGEMYDICDAWNPELYKETGKLSARDILNQDFEKRRILCGM